jgi:hypothetical protein
MGMHVANTLCVCDRVFRLIRQRAALSRGSVDVFESPRESFRWRNIGALCLRRFRDAPHLGTNRGAQRSSSSTSAPLVGL